MSELETPPVAPTEPPAPVVWIAPAQRNVTTPMEARRRSRQLFSTGVAVVIAAVGYYSYSAKVTDPLHLYLGLIILILATVPALMWAKRSQFGLPIFEVYMLTGINTYAIPILSGHQQVERYDDGIVTAAAITIVLFQLTAIAVFFSLRVRPRRTRLWKREIISRDVSRVLGYGMVVTTAYTAIIQFTDWIPHDLEGVIRAVCFGVGIIATFVQSRRWGMGELVHHEKITLVVQLIIQILLSWAALFLVQGISILLLTVLGYVSGSKKLPILPLAIAMPIIAILHIGKAPMRQKYWEQGAPMPSSITELPAFFSEWVGYGIDPELEKKQERESNKLLERSSLIHLLCLIISKTPEQVPYLMGETYQQIPGQFVPRFFNPNKDPGHISTYTLSIHYGLQTAEDTRTTIGFGMVNESYANFGVFGIIGLAIFLAGFFRYISGWAAESPIMSYPGMFMVVLMAWSFQTEAPMSMWLSSLFQATVVVIGVPLAFRSFLD